MVAHNLQAHVEKDGSSAYVSSISSFDAIMDATPHISFS